MQQLQLLEEDSNVSYMLPYMNDPYPMTPEVAKFLQSRPSWDVVLDVERWMRTNLPPYEKGEPDHYFSDGTYTRCLTIPAGIFMIGKKHAKGHVTMLMSGDATIITEHGQERVRGPRVWVDDPGIKRAIYAHDDCVFVTVHATNKTSVEEIEKELIVPEPELLEDYS